MARRVLLVAYTAVFAATFWMGSTGVEAHVGCTVNTTVTPNTWKGDEHANTCDAGGGSDDMWGYGDNDTLGGGGDRDKIRGAFGSDTLEDHAGGSDNDDECDGGDYDYLHVDDGDTRDQARFGDDGVCCEYAHIDSYIETSVYNGECPI